MSPATVKQQLGRLAERAVTEHVPCPRCSRPKHLSPLPVNFQCADLICKFCGYLAQVKAVSLREGSSDRPRWVLGAAWGPQQQQIIAGIFHGLYVVGYTPGRALVSIDYVPAHVLQASPEVYVPRAPLSGTARRAGWQGFKYDLDRLPPIGIVRVFPAQTE
jgi:hypothetical protein